jgi:hypothetical protein
MNGELVESEKATIHFLTPAHRNGVFEDLLFYPGGPAVFGCGNTQQTANLAGFWIWDFPYTPEELGDAIA